MQEYLVKERFVSFEEAKALQSASLEISMSVVTM